MPNAHWCLIACTKEYNTNNYIIILLCATHLKGCKDSPLLVIPLPGCKPDAAMYVLPTVFIFSITLYFGFDSNCGRIHWRKTHRIFFLLVIKWLCIQSYIFYRLPPIITLVFYLYFGRPSKVHLWLCCCYLSILFIQEMVSKLIFLRLSTYSFRK